MNEGFSPEEEAHVAPVERTQMNPSPYEVLDNMMNDQLVAKVLTKYGFTLALGGDGAESDSTITFKETHMGGGTYQQELHIPDAWMQATGATSADEFIDKLRAL